MNGVNVLFVISCIFVPLLLISLNYDSISDFYTYSIPLNDLVVEQFAFPSDPDRFQRIKQQEDSTCFVTPSDNEYCFEKPRGDEDFRFSHPIGSNGVSGEMHFEPVNHADGYWTMSSIIPISNDTVTITFSDNSDRYPDETLANWHITEEFEFTRTLEKYDTFVSHCSGNGKYVTLMQYLGIFTVDETDYVATWHIGTISDPEIICKYPEIIQQSFGHDFGI